MARLRVKVEPTARRIRAMHRGTPDGHHGDVAVDTTNALFVWEHPRYPMYYVPAADLTGRLTPGDDWDGAPHALATARRQTLRLPSGAVIDDVWTYPTISELDGYVRLDWAAFDWFEEDERVTVHPRDPYVRIDCLRSSRHVRVEYDGVVVAAAMNPVFLHETNLAPRVYIPYTSVRLDCFTPSPSRTACPYKGEATYLSLTLDGVVVDDVCWTYRTPTVEAANIAGMLGLYHEKLDVFIDGKRYSGQN